MYSRTLYHSLETFRTDFIQVDIPAYIFQDNFRFGEYGWSLSLSPGPTASMSSTPGTTSTTTITVDSTSYSTGSRTCDGSSYPQACFNYRSIGSVRPALANPTCAPSSIRNVPRPLTAIYNTQHNNIWINTWITKTYVNPSNKRKRLSCERDEWPPAVS